MVDTPIPVKKSASPNWYMDSRGAGTEEDPSTTFVLISGLNYLGKDRTTTTGAAEEITIPSGSKRAIISCAPSSQAYIEINGDATTSSPLYFEDPFGPIVLDLGSVTKLSAWVVAGNIGVVFFG